MTPTAKPKKRLPFIVILLIGIFAFCIFCSIASATMDALGLLPTSTPSLPPTNTPLPTQPAPPTATLAPVDDLRSRIEIKLGTSNRDVARLTTFDWSENDKSLIITWAINDNFGNDLIMVGTQTDVTDMLQIIAQSGLLPEYQFVTFVGTFPLRDSFGNVSEERVVTASYNKTTVDKINWDGFLYTDIFVIADLASIHPAMTAP